MLPKDPVMLLSYVNTQLRDNYSSLNELCSALGEDKEKLCRKIANVDYYYDENKNQFI